ncbi:MAG: phosphoribosylformylglycinamidine synthase I [Planctomycetota bacterium]|nr:phosphoribosylformylglycinamidine synthase I [Planctomycetota bacterium]
MATRTTAPATHKAPAKKAATKKAPAKKAPAKKAAARKPAAQRTSGRGSQEIRIVVLRAPGTNCDRETGYAFERCGATIKHLHVNALLAQPKQLAQAHGLVIPGGFSFGDDLGAGTVLGTALRTKLRDPMRRLVDRGGIVLGICNGFQVLVKTGLLPGYDESGDGEPDRTVALASNMQNRYEDRWVVLKAVTSKSVFLRQGDVLHCPVAHAEGRLVCSDATLDRMSAADQIALRYVGPAGESPAPFPHNPNGSLDDIAGITDPTGRVLGLMPHPERNQFPWQDPRFHRGLAPRAPAGLALFQNAMRHLSRLD